MGIASLAEQIRRFGAREAFASLGLRVAERAADLHVLEVIVIRRVNDEYLRIEPRYRHGFLDAPTLRSYARDAIDDFPDSFLDEALSRGDRCYAIREGERLASYGWYSRKPTPVDLGGAFQFDPRYVYMYKGFTHLDYRGRRLHAIGMTWALQHVLDEGLLGLVSYVDAANNSSLKSCYRMGYEHVGRIYAGRVRGRALALADAGARALGVRIVPEDRRAGGVAITAA
ncbi:MAG: hypothetical protein QM820_63190 [Minicystis sp.]